MEAQDRGTPEEAPDVAVVREGFLGEEEYEVSLKVGEVRKLRR